MMSLLYTYSYRIVENYKLVFNNQHNIAYYRTIEMHMIRIIYRHRVRVPPNFHTASMFSMYVGIIILLHRRVNLYK